MRTSSAALAVLLLAGAPALPQDGARPNGAPYPEVIHPDDLRPLPDGFVMTRGVTARPAPRQTPDQRAIDLPREISDKLAACWAPPAVAANETAQVTVRLAFRNDGSVIGTPATPFLQAATDDKRRALRESLLAAIRACTPLRFTPSLGKAIAGRIFAIRYIVHHVASEQRI